MKISFCTTCMGRLEHLMQTLPRNLADNPNQDGLAVEFVVLNYGDKDGMHEWMTTDSQIQEEIKAGRIIYARTDQPVFRMAHAKNMAHRLATGDVVCNLDADNFTGQGFAAALKGFFEEHPNGITNPSHAVSRHFHPDERGFFGRVALRREQFLKLGGYSEAFKGWGGEDTDLTRRARLLGMDYHRFEDMKYLGVITHDSQERVQNMFTTDGERQTELDRITEIKHSEGFKKLWHAAWDRGYVFYKSIVANSGKNFGIGHINYFNNQDISGNLPPLDASGLGLSRSIVARGKGMVSLAKGRLSPSIVKLSDFEPTPM